jgi:hypothetical protein
MAAAMAEAVKAEAAEAEAAGRMAKSVSKRS